MKFTKNLIFLSTLYFIISLSLFYFATPIQAILVEYQDSFDNDEIGSEWDIKNYRNGEDGSFSGYSAPLSFKEEGEVINIQGTGETESLGWIGKTLLLNSEFALNSQIQIEARINFRGGVSGYATALTIEFDKDNRVVLNYGNTELNDKFINLTFEEDDVNRCGENKCVNNVIYHLNEYHTIRLIFDPTTTNVSAYYDDILIVEDKFNGYISNFHVGLVGIVRRSGDTLNSDVDYFKLLSDSVPTEIPVPDIKQFSNPWGPLEYDFASSWYPTNPTISRWGCAITSAAMILNYYAGYTDPLNLAVSPQQLNNWLKANNGYTRNGNVLLPSIASFSLMDDDIPTVEFSYRDYSFDLTKSELEANMPPMLKLKRILYDKKGKPYNALHFLVAKGIDNNEIKINDPGRNNTDTLLQANSFWGDTVQLGSFKKSETDLSYMVLLIDNDFDIKVSGSSGEIKGDQYYFEEGPMMDPANPDSDSEVETLNAFYYPKPDTGEYLIKVDGDGVYQLDYYAYDEEGDIKTGILFGSHSDGEPDSLELSFDKLNSDLSIVPEITFDSVLKYWGDIYDDGFVTDYGVYISVKKLIENAFKNNIKNGLSSKALLEAVLQKVRESTPDQLSEDASYYFQKQIEILFASL